PLAKSDFLSGDIHRSIRAICEGLNGEVLVNGRKYSGMMPPVVLDDKEVAEVLTYVLNSWGNPGGSVSAEVVERERAKSAFPTVAALKKASSYPPLPFAPEGFTLREVARLAQKGVRLASDGRGEVLYILSETGDVWRLETKN